MTATAADIDRPRRDQAGAPPPEVSATGLPWQLGGYVRRFLPRR